MYINAWNLGHQVTIYAFNNTEIVYVPETIVMRIGIYVMLSIIKEFILMSHTFIKDQL